MVLQLEECNMEMLSVKEKLVEAKALLGNINAGKRLREEEAYFIKVLLDEQATIIDILRNENFRIKEMAPQLQPLHENFLKYQQDADDAILSLNLKLSDMRLKVLELEKKLTEFGMNLVQFESAKVKEIDELNHQWQEKSERTHGQTKCMIEEIIKKHCEAKKGYETVIHGLKEQISHKEAEVAWCQLMMKERDINIDKEMGNLKKELEVTTTKNQELLQQRLVEVERRANKMTRKCLKLQQDYEQKITTLKKEKDLQVLTLQKYLQNEAERDTFAKAHKIEDAVKELEVRYRKIIVNLHSASQEQRMKDMKKIATLETSRGTVAERIGLQMQ